MANKFFISDTHFFHEKILLYADQFEMRSGARKFQSLEERHEFIVEQWNSVVGPKDIVYHLGDVTFKPNERRQQFEWLWARLNGRKFLNPGNHDKASQMMPYFEEIEYWNVFHNENFFTSHIPLPEQEFRKTDFQVHGHTHSTSKGIDGGRYICVSVEAWDFKPASMDEILDIIQERQAHPRFGKYRLNEELDLINRPH